MEELTNPLISMEASKVSVQASKAIIQAYLISQTIIIKEFQHKNKKAALHYCPEFL